MIVTQKSNRTGKMVDYKINRHTTFKEYPRTYEFVYKKQLVKQDSFKPERVKILDIEIPDYIKFIQDYTNGWERILWTHYCTLFWIEGRFEYNGRNKYKYKKKDIKPGTAIPWVGFLKHYVGTNNKIMTLGISAVIYSYIRELVPNADTKTELSDFDIEFPYKFIGLSHMFLVYQMPERNELLKIADDRKMAYWDFLEYIINYISCYNYEYGKQYVLDVKSLAGPNYVSWRGYKQQ